MSSDKERERECGDKERDVGANCSSLTNCLGNVKDLEFHA